MNATIPAASSPLATQAPARRSSRLLIALLCLVAAALFALHFLHLSADFPTNTPWMDWAKYTDEGWYGDAAIRLVTTGHWHVPGDFNPAVALPVWPVLLGLLFHLTGLSLVAARALAVSVFGLAALTVAHLVRRTLADLDRQQNPTRPPSAAPALAAAGLLVLLAASPFLFAFSRMAILEPPLLLFGLLALLAASTQPPLPASRTPLPSGDLHTQGTPPLAPEMWFSRPEARPTLRPALLVGLLLPLMVLTKTTAVFLVPSILWMLFARAGYRLRAALPPLLTALGLAATLWLLYFGLLVHPHFLDDYHYLFNANGYTGITAATALQVLSNTFRDSRWISPTLAPAALLAIAVALLLRPLRRQPLLASLLLWIAGYTAFLAYHNNLQPRYYLVPGVALLALLPLTLGALWITTHPATTRSPLHPAARPLTLVATALLALVTLHDALTTIRYTRTPTYSFLAAARQIQHVIAADPTHSQLLLSVSGSDISLMTGLRSICDDFGTLELDERLTLYRPGWYAAWNHVEDDKMDAFASIFRLTRVAAFPAYDDPERNLLILYRLDPADDHTPIRRHHRRAIPRRLITRTGQQPSPTQLQH